MYITETLKIQRCVQLSLPTLDNKKQVKLCETRFVGDCGSGG